LASLGDKVHSPKNLKTMFRDKFVSVLLKISFSHGDSMKGQSPCSLQILKTLLGVEVSTSINFKGSLKKSSSWRFYLGSLSDNKVEVEMCPQVTHPKESPTHSYMCLGSELNSIENHLIKNLGNDHEVLTPIFKLDAPSFLN
jgi:hypothetical protein